MVVDEPFGSSTLETTNVPETSGIPFHVKLWLYDCPGWRVCQVAEEAASWSPAEAQSTEPLLVSSNAAGPVSTTTGWFPVLVSVKVKMAGSPESYTAWSVVIVLVTALVAGATI